MQEISLQKKNFFNSIGLNINSLPKELLSKIEIITHELPEEEINFLNNESLTSSKLKHFCLKHIVGSINEKYDGLTWLKLFLNNPKTDELIKQYFKNPNSYFTDCKKTDNENIEDDSLELYEDNGKIFIKKGIEKISLMMIKYLLEMSRADSKEERLIINKRYIFTANITSVPKDKEIMYLVNMLLNLYGNKLEIRQVKNSEQCNYTIKYGEKVIEIATKEELEKFVRNSYLPKEYKSMEKLKNKIISLLGISKISSENAEKINVVEKLFPNYSIFVKYYKKIKENNLEQELYERLDLDEIKYEVILKKMIKIIKQKENDIMSEKKVKKENNIVKSDASKASKKEISDANKVVKKEVSETKEIKKINKGKKEKIDENKLDELDDIKSKLNEKIPIILENINMTYYKMQQEENEMIELAESTGVILSLDKINCESINSSISSIQDNFEKIIKKINNIDDIFQLKKIMIIFNNLVEIANDHDININYAEDLNKVFNKSFNRTVQKLINESKLKELDIKREEIESEKCSFFSKLLGKAKLKQAKLDNINLKKQLILSESQYLSKSYYSIEDGLSEAYAYIRAENDDNCLADVKLFLSKVESNIRLKKIIDKDKVSRKVEEKLEQQRNLPQIVLSKEKKKFFSKAQINLMEEKNNELKRVIQVTRANSLKQQNTGAVPIIGTEKRMNSLNKFYNNLNEINLSLQYQNN